MLELFKNKTVWAGLLILLIMVVSYKMFFNAEEASQTVAAPIGADLLKMADELSRAELGTELFSSNAYLFLSDFSTPVPQQAVGRKNPFDVIGRD